MQHIPSTEYLENKKYLQNKLLEFLDNEQIDNNIFTNITQQINAQNLLENKPELYLLFKLITTISNNHHRSPNFFPKIFQILNYLKIAFKQLFSNSEIFKLFKSNKRILLFLIQNGYLQIDESIIEKLKSKKYVENGYFQYFYPELKPFIKENDPIQKVEISDYFEKDRELGENEIQLCCLIRNDSIEDFIIYINKFDIPLSFSIKPSIFETNSFLLENNNNTTLIKYAAFFGSIRIFEYLLQKNVEIDDSIWLYAIHGRNAEILNHIENQSLIINENLIIESIKCHHNEISEYIRLNYLNDLKIENVLNLSVLKYYDFLCFPSNLNVNNEIFFYYLCKYNYYQIVKDSLPYLNIDINTLIISNKKIFFLMKIIKTHQVFHNCKILIKFN